MADELPPIAPMPESNIPPALLGQMAHAADWAQTFSGQDTNIVQRYRHNQDINAYAQGLAEARAAAQAQLIQSNQVAQNLYFNTLKLDLQEKQAAQRMAHDAALHPIKMQAEEARAKANQALELRRVNESALADTIAAHEHGFFADRAAFHASNPEATQQEIDSNDLALRSQYPHAMKVDAAKGIVAEAVGRQKAASATLSPAQHELSAYREIRRLQSRDAQLAKDVGAIEKVTPAWLDSTGYEEKTGQFRFAKELQKDGTGTAPFKPSEAQLSQYKSYKAALAERAKIAAQLGEHEAKLAAGFSGVKGAGAVAETPAQIVARIKASGGTKEDAAIALRNAGHKY